MLFTRLNCRRVPLWALQRRGDEGDLERGELRKMRASLCGCPYTARLSVCKNVFCSKRTAEQMSKTSNAEVGQRAPDFRLRDGSDQEWALAQQRGKVVVLLFYPGDETPICTRQLCSLRDRWDDYSVTGAEVVGISTDSVESHKRFAEHHDLPLRLLSDAGGDVARMYGAQSLIPGKVARSVFVIDAEGIVRYRDVRPLGLFRPKDEDVIRAIREAHSEAVGSRL